MSSPASSAETYSPASLVTLPYASAGPSSTAHSSVPPSPGTSDGGFVREYSEHVHDVAREEGEQEQTGDDVSLGARLQRLASLTVAPNIRPPGERRLLSRTMISAGSA
jgi:hypothetical protein